MGAGVAGLAAADRLHAACRSILVLEAGDRVGGRTLSRRVPGGSIDLGATWFWPGEEHVARVVRRFAVSTFEQSIDGDAVFERADSTVGRLRGNPIDVPAHRFAEGAQVIPRHLAAALPVDAVRLSAPVHHVEIESGPGSVDGGGRVLVHSADGSVLAEHVVLAVPPARALGITFDPPLPAPLQTLAAGTPVDVVTRDWSAGTSAADQPREQPAQQSYGHPLFQQPVAGRIHWASTETSRRAPGHLEGALASGNRAGAEVLARLLGEQSPIPTQETR